MAILMYSELVEFNGKTVRQNNMEKSHKFPLGSLVEVEVSIYDPGYVDLKGKCLLFVVKQGRDCDGTPLYLLSSIPVIYPESKILSPENNLYKAVAKICEFGYSEDNMELKGSAIKLYEDIREYFGF